MVNVPKPKGNPTRKKSSSSSVNYNSGNRRTTDVDQSHANNAERRRREAQHTRDVSRTGTTQDRNMRQTDTGNVVRNRRSEQERRSQQHQQDSARSGRTVDRQMRQTDTGTRSRNERIKDQRRKEWSANYDINKNAQKINQYADNNTGRSSKKTYGNSESTKKAMQKKYGNSRNKASAYDRADYKGREIERKVKQRWKPSDVSSQRPGESGREWGNHKYIDKVRTKSGKIRYIYNIEGGGSSHEDAGKTMRKNHNSKASSQINYNKAQARKAARSAGNKVKAFFSKLFG